MFLIIALKKSFKNVALVSFLEFFGHEHKFETWFDHFPEKKIPKVIWKSFYF